MYDENDLVSDVQTWQCANLSDCKLGIYTPQFKVRYENRDNDQLDYFSFRHYVKASDRWVLFDSISNLYNENGEIIEFFWQSYEGNFPEKLNYTRRYTFNYSDFVITDLPEVKSEKPYPNPASDKIFLNIPREIFSTLTLTNTMGQEVNAHLKGSSQGYCELDVSHLNSGIYLLRYFINNRPVTERVVKK